MSWKRLKDIVASTAVNSNKMLVVTAADVVTTVVGEDVVQEAISNSNNVKNAFNTQVSTAITNDPNVQNSFNTQVSNAITNDGGVQNSLTTSVNNINNQAGTTVTYVNPPTVNGQPLLALPTSENDGDHLMYDGMGTTDVSAKKLLVKASAAERTQLVNFGQASSQQRTAASFQRILTDFYRFSHGSRTTSNLGFGTNQVNFNDPNMLTNTTSTFGNHAGVNYTFNGPAANEEGDWSLNASNEITQGINSNFWIGFASPPDELYDTYDATIVLKSAGRDDDMIGFVIALNRGDPADPNAQGPLDTNLMVFRSLNTSSGTGLSMQINAGLPTQANIATAASGLFRNDLSNPSSGQASNSFGTPLAGTGWAAYNGCALKIERRPNRVRVWGIDDVSNAPSLDSPAWGNPVFDIDLTADARLAEFQNPGNWGLNALSQGLCSWGDLMFNGVSQGGLSLNPKPDPTINNMVFDVESGTTYVWNNGAWEVDPQGRTIHDYVDSGQMLLDTASGSLYVKDNGELQLLQSTRSQGVELDANSGITVNDIGKLIVAGPGCSELTFDGNYGIGWHCTVLNKSGGTLTLKTSGSTRFGDLLGPGRTEINLGDSREAKCYGNGHNGGANIHLTTSAGDYGT